MLNLCNRPNPQSLPIKNPLLSSIVTTPQIISAYEYVLEQEDGDEGLFHNAFIVSALKSAAKGQLLGKNTL